MCVFGWATLPVSSTYCAKYGNTAGTLPLYPRVWWTKRKGHNTFGSAQLGNSPKTASIMSITSLQATELVTEGGKKELQSWTGAQGIRIALQLVWPWSTHPQPGGSKGVKWSQSHHPGIEENIWVGRIRFIVHQPWRVKVSKIGVKVCDVWITSIIVLFSWPWQYTQCETVNPLLKPWTAFFMFKSKCWPFSFFDELSLWFSKLLSWYIVIQSFWCLFSYVESMPQVFNKIKIKKHQDFLWKKLWTSHLWLKQQEVHSVLCSHITHTVQILGERTGLVN